MAYTLSRTQLAFIAMTMLILSSSLAHAQDPMAKWKPSVGDRFIYNLQIHQTVWSMSGSHDGGTFDGSPRSVIISQIDTTIQGHSSVVMTTEDGNPEFY